MSDLDRAILDATVALIAEQGVRAVSFREVARRAGVSHQAPYHRFGDVRGILRAVAREGFAALTADMRSAADTGGVTALDGLSAAGVAYVLFARKHLGHFLVMFQHTLLGAGDDVLPEAEATYALLHQLAQGAVASGAGGGLDGDAVAHLCWSTVHGLATLLVEGPLGAKAAAAHVDELTMARSVVGALRGLLGADRGPIQPPRRPPPTGRTRRT